MKRQWTREYTLHAALNLGQAARDLRYFYYHPKADGVARSIPRRVLSLGNNVLFTVLPPQLHHTEAELGAMMRGSHWDWFLYGFAPWQYSDPSK